MKSCPRSSGCRMLNDVFTYEVRMTSVPDLCPVYFPALVHIDSATSMQQSENDC